MSLKEIARMTGVSPSTVSRVLSGALPGCASAAVRDRVLKAAAEIGYAPNASARNLRSGEAAQAPIMRVGVVLARIRSLEDDPFFMELFRALTTECYQQGCAMSGIRHVEDERDVDAGDADGLVVLGRCSEKLLATLKRRSRNIVGIWRNPLNYEVDEVVCDGQKAASLAVSYLRSLGHLRIAYIGDCSYESRYVGYTETLIRSGLPLDYDLVLPTDQTAASGYEAMRKLLTQDVGAVLCANDATAIGALRALRGEKKRRVSVISIDDIDEAQETKPMLTTVSIPRADMAHMAILLLLDRMRKGHVRPLRVELPCDVVVRESCYPADATKAIPR